MDESCHTYGMDVSCHTHEEYDAALEREKERKRERGRPCMRVQIHVCVLGV